MSTKIIYANDHGHKINFYIAKNVIDMANLLCIESGEPSNLTIMNGNSHNSVECRTFTEFTRVLDIIRKEDK